VLRHAFPDAAIPVVQLSINQFKDFGYHLDLGARLAPLRDRGVLIVASGNIVHNLAGISVRLADTGFDWAERFDADARERMLTDPAEIARLDAHRDFASAVPTPDHFIPLLYLAGLAAAARDGAPRDETGRDPDDATRVLVDGCAYGSLSMTAYTLGLDVPDATGTGPAARAPEGIPADETNL
jgi:4,5-DOPA dioxygenase extradiol